MWRTQILIGMLAGGLCLSPLSITAQLEVRGVGSLLDNGERQIHVSFSEPVDASGESLSNYSLNEGTLVGASRLTGLPPEDGYLPSGVENPTPDGRPVDNSVVVLEASGLTTGEEYELTISGVDSMEGETLDEVTESFVATAWEARQIGEAPSEGQAIAVSDTGFDLVSSGTGFWQDTSQVTFVSQSVSGEFDLQGRVAFQDISSQWPRTGIMMWETFEGENNGENVARYVTAHANRQEDFNEDGSVEEEGGNNAFESNWRMERENPADSQAGGGGGTPEYPNAWVRLTRDGDNIRAFHSSDGEEWTQIDTDRSYDRIPSPLHIGPMYSPETANTGAFGEGKQFLMQIRDVSFTTEPFGPVTITRQPQSQTVEENQTATLSVGTSGSPVRIQWSKDGEALEGAMSNELRFEPVTMADAGTYQVRVENPEGEGEPSDEATLEVEPDQTPPSMLWAASTDAQTVFVQFSEPLDPSSAETAGNYSIEGGNVTGASLASENPNRVVLTTDGLTVNERFTLTAEGVEDTAGVAVEEGAEIDFRAQDIQLAGEEADFVGLPTARRTPLDSGTERGFNLKIVQNTQGVTTVAGAEQQLAGELTDDEGEPLPNLASPEETIEEADINYSQAGTFAGFLAGDRMFPSVENTGSQAEPQTDMFSMEATAFLRLEQGVYAMGITSDDGFRLSSDGKVLSEFDGTRGAEQNFFDLVVPMDGLYPFRLVYFENAGGNTVEWFVLNDPSPQDPQTNLSGVNGTDFVQAFTEREGEPVGPATLSVQQSGPNEITISWEPAGGTLQSASSVTGPWTDVTDESPHSVAPEATSFFRVVQ